MKLSIDLSVLMYTTVILIAALLGGGSKELYNKHNPLWKLIWMLSAVTLFLPLAMRSMGVDYSNYQATYAIIGDGGSSFWESYQGRPEPLYAFLNYFVYNVFQDYQYINVFCAVLTVFFLYAGLSKYFAQIRVGYTVLGIGATCYLFMFGLNRMMISVAIITWAYHFITEQKFKSFLVWCVIATGFHYSAIIMVVLYPLLIPKEHSHKSIWRMIILIPFIIWGIYSIAPRLFSGFYWWRRYAIYYSADISIATLNNDIFALPLIVFILLFYSRIPVLLPGYEKWRNFVIAPTILIVCSVFFPLHRLTYYFYPAIAIAYGGLSRFRGVKNKALYRIVFFFVFVFFSILWFINTLCYNELWSPYLLPYCGVSV